MTMIPFVSSAVTESQAEALFTPLVNEQTVSKELEAFSFAAGAAFKMLQMLLPEAAKTVEQASLELTDRFKTLANNARTQSTIVENLSNSISAIPLEDKHVTLDEFIKIFSETLDDTVTKLMFVSKRSIAMTYSMEDAIAQLVEVERFSQAIQDITKKTHILALNAKIEANRAGGELGQGFGVVADEVKVVSSQISTISRDMALRTRVIMQCVEKGYELLKDMATTDMTQNIKAKDTLEKLMRGLKQQNVQTQSVMRNSAEVSGTIAQSIQGMIVDLQFQDRNSQITENVVNIVHECEANLERLRQTLKNFSGGNEGEVEPFVEQAVQAIVSVIKLGDIRNQYIDALKVLGRYQSVTESLDAKKSAAAQDDIDLF